jgi:hypothetical protein
MATIPDKLTHEYLDIIHKYYPRLGSLLDLCYVKVIDCFIERLGKRCYYIGIYCPDELVQSVYTHHRDLQEVAENMGLTDAVLLNAARIIRDPMSKLKIEDPRLWLEIYWVALQRFSL